MVLRHIGDPGGVLLPNVLHPFGTSVLWYGRRRRYQVQINGVYASSVFGTSRRLWKL